MRVNCPLVCGQCGVGHAGVCGVLLRGREEWIHRRGRREPQRGKGCGASAARWGNLSVGWCWPSSPPSSAVLCALCGAIFRLTLAWARQPGPVVHRRPVDAFGSGGNPVSAEWIACSGLPGPVSPGGGTAELFEPASCESTHCPACEALSLDIKPGDRLLHGFRSSSFHRRDNTRYRHRLRCVSGHTSSKPDDSSRAALLRWPWPRRAGAASVHS